MMMTTEGNYIAPVASFESHPEVYSYGFILRLKCPYGDILNWNGHEM